LQVRENIPLAPFTTLRVGGPARFFVRAASESDVQQAIKFATERGLPLFVLGGGSNVVVADSGFTGLVLMIAIAGFAHHPDDESIVTVGAGENWDAFVSGCVKRGLAGVECLSGIPGTVGGTPVQNVGAYGQEVSETIRAVRCFDLRSGTVVTLSNDACEFGYRRSVFNTTERGRYVVLDVTFELRRGGAPKITYRDLAGRFGDRQPTLIDTRKAVLDIRRAKSMVIDDGDPNSRSAGSFFKNPVVTSATHQKIASEFGDVPGFAQPDGTIKIPAAWLIERTGFYKGYAVGPVGLSTKHTLAIVNRGGATAAEIVQFASAIQKRVVDVFGIELRPEPVFIGF